jgi:N-acetylglucosaminyl-diphospho-decaprenol L-rhamnosyltransferase
MKLAIIVVTYQAQPYLDGLFSTLKQHTDLDDIAVVVVDNASSDGTLAELSRIGQSWANLHVLPQAKNTGFAEGNNIGLRWARERGAAFALLLNQDIEVTPGWLGPLLSVMDARSEVAAVQPLVVLHAEPHLINTAGNELHFCGFGYCGSYRQPIASIPPDGENRSVAFASGAALLLRMDALARSGDLDEKLFLYHEDCELQIRLRQLGYDCVLVPRSRVLHKYTERFSARKYALLERNRWLVLLKDWPLARLAVAAPALAGAELAVLVFAARQGWLRAKLSSYGEILRLLPAVLRDRRPVQMNRSAKATDGASLTGSIRFPGLDHPLITRVANPVLSAYWSFARKILRVP